MLPENEKILVLTHPECDYGAQMIFNGLCEILGPGRVLPYPDKLSYYGQQHNYSLTDIPNGMTCPTPWAVPIPRPYTGKYVDNEGVAREDQHPVYEIRAMLRDGIIKCVLVESLREWAVNAYQELHEDIVRAGATVIAMDGEDYHHLVWNQLRRINPKVLLKREMRIDSYESGDMNIEGLRVIGFPFSACTTKVYETCPDYYPQLIDKDVTFLCGRTADFRQWIANTIRDEHEINSLVAISPDDRNSTQPLFCWEQYIQHMHTSWIAVSARGWGYDSVRFWEALLVAPVFAQNPGLHVQNPLIPDEHYVEFDSSNMISKMKDWLGRKEDLLSLYRRGREHTVACHSNAARARRVIELFMEYR